MRFEIKFIDSGREPQCAPNPDYPLGIDLDTSRGAMHTCKTTLPYPAKRCGAWVVKCLDCGYVAAVSTAGRPDDPRSLTLPCKIQNVTKQ